jgi:4-amino-4-deoxy-L-arabinose transferase-like glycosyltransferase
LSDRPAPSSSRTHLVILLIIILLGAGVRVVLSNHHQQVDFDEGRYLDNAVHLLEDGALSTSTLSHFFGDPEPPPRPEDMSSPFYPVLLALLFSVTGISFTSAKALSLLLGIGAIPLVYMVGRRLFNPTAGLVAAAAFALQPDQAIVSVWTMTEALFTVLVLAVILTASPWMTGEEGVRSGKGRLLILAIFLALLFLTRQNGAAIAVAVSVMMVSIPGLARDQRVQAFKQAIMLAVAVFVLCLPWFIRNAQVFGSPTFSRMENVAWADHGRALYTPGVGEPSFSSFKERHGTAGVMRNIKRRVERVAGTLLFAEKGPYRVLVFAALGSLFMPAIVRSSLAVLVPSLLSTGLLLGVAPWSGALSRYMLPVRPLLYAAGAALILRLLGSLGAKLGTDSRILVKIGAGVAGIGFLWALATAVPIYSGYLDRDQSGPARLAAESSEWIVGNTNAGALLMEGAFLHEYAYRFRRGVVWTPFGDLDQALATADRYGVDYLLVTRDVIRFRPELSRNWAVEGEAIRPLLVPDRLEPVYDRADQGLIIYRLGRHASPKPLE